MNLETMKLKLDISKAEAAKMELEYKIFERKEEIKRMEAHIVLQDERIKECKEKLEQ